MSVKPVAWMGESPGGSLLISKHQADSYEWLDRKWKVTPLYSAPAPELAEALQAFMDQYDSMPDGELGHGLTNEPFLNARKLLARITPK